MLVLTKIIFYDKVILAIVPKGGKENGKDSFGT